MKSASNPSPIFKTIALFGAVLMIFLLGPALSQAQSANHQPNIAPDEFTTKGYWDIGTTVPNLKLNDVFNKKFELYSKLDKVVVLELFTMDNAQCTKNKKYLKSFYKQYPIEIISITTDQYVNQLRDYTRNHQIAWHNIIDDSAKFDQPAFAKANFSKSPKFVVITPDKRVHAIMHSEKEVGKLGVLLQQYFGNR